MPLTLNPIGLVNTDIPGSPDDYLVLEDGIEIGRIQRDRAHETRWIWTNKVIPNQTGDRGDANSRQEAMIAFRIRWDSLGDDQKDSARGWRVGSRPIPQVPVR